MRLKILFALTLVLSTAQGCAIWQRSDRATNVEAPDPQEQAQSQAQPLTQPESREQPEDQGQPVPPPFAGIAPAPQQLAARTRPGEAGAPDPKIKEAASLFASASKEQNDAAFMKAAALWKDFLDRETGLPGYDEASYNYGYCLFSLGHVKEAAERLKNLVASSGDSALVNDARILLSESLIQLKNYDEALAVTFEVLPNSASEEAFALKRDSDAVGTARNGSRPSLTQKIRLYTIRGRIYAALNQDGHAREALEHAKTLLIHVQKTKISRWDMGFLSANYAWRRLEVQALSCSHQNTVPERLSEAEFLAYADAYYGCAEPARHLYCTVLAAGNEQVTAQALRTYRGLVEAPLSIKEHLPPPARAIKKPGTVSQYESDMKALIEKTVAERSREFRDIPTCHAHDIF